MRFSLRLNNDVPVERFVAVARAAETAGFDQLWVSNDLFLRSAPVLLTTAAEHTTHIGLGAGILNPYSIHPAEIAMTAATLQEQSDGRFLLGLAAGAADFLRWAGIERTRPLARTSEAVRAIRALLAGDRPARHDGTGTGWTDDAHLRIAAADVPVYVGAMGPKMLTMAGRQADGILPLLFPPESYTTVRERVAAGARDAGRRLADLDLAACVWLSLDDDADRARAALADKIAYFGPSFSPHQLARVGLQVADLEPLREAIDAGQPERARTMITDRMLHLGIAGGPDEVIDRCRDLVDRGATHLSFGPPIGPDLLPAVQRLGAEVLPDLRAA